MLFAVHISDGILTAPVWCAGFAVTALLFLLGLWRIREEEIPRVALVTAALFVASLIHVRIGPTSVHLLLNGLAGVLLGLRAAVAIPIGVAMQAFLFAHGGFYTIGVTSAIMVVPALLAGSVFRATWKRAILQTKAAQLGLLAVSFAVLGLGLAFVVRLLTNLGSEVESALESAASFTFEPVMIGIVAGCAMVGSLIVHTWIHTPTFALAWTIGELTVLASVSLNYLVLLVGAAEGIRRAAAVTLAVHLPVAVIEGVVLGFALGFLTKVKPELLLNSRAEETPHPVEPPTAPGPR